MSAPVNSNARPFSRMTLALAALLFFIQPMSYAVSCSEGCKTPLGPQQPLNIYSNIGADQLSPVVALALPRVYVPNHASNSISVIDPATLKVVANYKVGLGPQHVIPAWDLKTLWVANNANRTNFGSMTPIDPVTAMPGKKIWVTDPYNMYFMPDGSSAIIVDEAMKQLDLRDPQTMKLKSVIPTPTCHGINHADFAADYSYAIFTCEFRGGSLIKVDLQNQKVIDTLDFSIKGMPQDIRLSPDGKTFFITDMMNNGVFLIDAESFTEVGFIATGIGAHGLNVSRDGKKLYVANRGSSRMPGHAKGSGGVTVIDFATQEIEEQWTVPNGGSPDMGNVSADGKQLWLSGRFDNVVYVFDTNTGSVQNIPVGGEPHGLTIWPQPGRISLGHTGNMR